MADHVLDELLTVTNPDELKKTDKSQDDKIEKDKAVKEKFKKDDKKKDKGKGNEKPYDMRERSISKPSGLESIMERGFAALQDSLGVLNQNVCGMSSNVQNLMEYAEEEQYDEYFENDDVVGGDDEEDEPLVCGDVLDDVTSEMSNEELTSGKLNDKVAKLINFYMSEKPCDAVIEKRNKKYLRPENCEYLKVPKMNQEIWNSIPSYSKKHDLDLQKAQLNLVKGVIPVGQLIDQLYAVKGKLSNESFDVDEAIRSLVDTIGFVGAANCAIVQKRKSLLRPKLAPKFQKLCSSSEFSSDSLFGKDLAQEVKTINEMGKLTQDITKPGTSGYVPPSSYRGRGRGFVPRGRGRFFRRGLGFGRRGLSHRGRHRFGPYGSFEPLAASVPFYQNYGKYPRYWNDKSQVKSQASGHNKPLNLSTPSHRGGN